MEPTTAPAIAPELKPSSFEDDDEDDESLVMLAVEAAATDEVLSKVKTVFPVAAQAVWKPAPGAKVEVKRAWTSAEVDPVLTIFVMVKAAEAE